MPCTVSRPSLNAVQWGPMKERGESGQIERDALRQSINKYKKKENYFLSTNRGRCGFLRLLQRFLLNLLQIVMLSLQFQSSRWFCLFVVAVHLLLCQSVSMANRLLFFLFILFSSAPADVLSGSSVSTRMPTSSPLSHFDSRSFHLVCRG